MKKKINIFLILIITVVIILLFAIIKQKIYYSKDVKYVSVDYEKLEENNENKTIEDESKVKSIAEENGANINNFDIYDIKTEYDGREYIAIKDSISFKIALAGAIKKDKPKLDNLDEEIKKAPTHSGIWIEDKSREKVLEHIKQITKGDYKIDQDGFLIQNENLIMNNYDKKIRQILLTNELYVFTVNSECYILDEITGEIVLYPFEEMDPHQSVEVFESNKKHLFFISEGKLGKTSIKDSIQKILESI